MIDLLSQTDFRALAVFRSVAQYRGFAAAEHQLGVRSSTISAQIAGLERRLGYRLCERGRTGFRLTERGREILAAHERLVDEMNTFRETAEALSDKAVGTLRLGVMDHTSPHPGLSLIELVSDFHRIAPQVHIEIVQDIQSNLRDLVLKRRIDLAIGAFADADPQFDLQQIGIERQSIYCGISHPWWFDAPSHRDRDQIAAAGWIRRSYVLAPLEGFPVVMGQVRGTAANLEAVAVMLQALPALGYLPDHFAASHVRDGRLRKVTDQYAVVYAIGLLSRSGRRDTKSMQRFRDIVRLSATAQASRPEQ